jgi:ribonucleotide reductase beta subunit family protein with ferritin-like domain
MSANINEEYLTKSNPDRFVIFPIKHNDIWMMYKKQREGNWLETDIDLTTDLKDWKTLNYNEKHFIKNILAFFAASDGIVMENITTNFATEIQLPEARMFYSAQSYIEGVHSITYSLLIETLISNADEKNKLFRAISTIPAVAKKSNWAIKWMNNNINSTEYKEENSLATRIVAFAAVEGIFFSGAFCSIYWIKESGKMPGLCKSNEFIARDEGLHTEFACLLYTKYIKNKLSDKHIHSIIKEAVDIEIEFIIDSLPCKLLGMNSDLMIQYIKYVANRLVLQLGHLELYPNAIQPFGFMDKICLQNKTNFFEERVSEYRLNSETIKLDKLTTDDNF